MHGKLKHRTKIEISEHRLWVFVQRPVEIAPNSGLRSIVVSKYKIGQQEMAFEQLGNLDEFIADILSDISNREQTTFLEQCGMHSSWTVPLRPVFPGSGLDYYS